MGSRKKQTVGHHYKWIMHHGWCRSADAVLAFRAGGVDAWQGRLQANASLYIARPQLWGGEDGEGGMEGYLDVMFGNMTQGKHPYLASQFGPKQSANRGVVSTLWKGGRFGAMIPNPKTVELKIERILTDWHDDAPWYPERAAIPIGEGMVPEGISPESGGWRYLVTSNSDGSDYSAKTFDDSAWAVSASPFASSDAQPYAAEAGYPVQRGTNWPINTTLWARRQFTVIDPSRVLVQMFVDNFATVWVNGHLVMPRAGSSVIPGVESFLHEFVIPADVVQPGNGNVLVLKAEDYGSHSYAAFKVLETSSGVSGMNPAHMIYDAITHPDMMGEPAALIDEASFTAAANRAYAEGFGLCTSYDSDEETPEEFIRRIANVFGAACSQSRADGKYYLDLARGGYDIDALPVIRDEDIIEFEFEPVPPSEQVNCVRVEWFDPEADGDRKRTTPPIYSLGNIRSIGEVIEDTRRYPEVPNERLALRKAASDLGQSSKPLSRVNLVLSRRLRHLRIGMPVRLLAPKHGIADMVIRAGQMRHGTHADGRFRMAALEDVFAMPETTHTRPSPGEWLPPDPVARPSIAQRAVEAPYVELAATLPPAELQALQPDAGYVLTMALFPASGRSYDIATAAAGETHEVRGVGDWCPSGIVEAQTEQDQLTMVQLAGASLLDRVAVGSWALWDQEICRVDAVELDTGAVLLGRGCADTVRAPHAVGSRIFFCGDWVGSDTREYVAGDQVDVRLLTRTSSNLLAIADAVPLLVGLNARANRPYPPAGLLINGEADPTVAVGELLLSWRNRDRVIQADQLVDDSMLSTGAEAGQTAIVRYYLNGLLVHVASDIEGEQTTFAPGGAGLLRIEVGSVRDGVESWQFHVRELSLGNPLLDESGELLTFDDDQPILME